MRGTGIRLSCLGLLAALIAACASTRLSSVWKDEAYRAGPMARIAVLVVDQDEATRRYAEDEAVRSLPPGTAGVPSYRLFDRQEPDIAKVKARLAAEGFDGVLVGRLARTDKRKTYVPPQVHVLPGPFVGVPYYRSFYRFYGYAWNDVYASPGYTVETTRVIVETLVYALPEGRLVWSAVSETVDPDSTAELLAQLVKVVRGRLQRDGLIAGG